MEIPTVLMTTLTTHQVPEQLEGPQYERAHDHRLPH